MKKHARYGIATGLAFRWLEGMRAQGIERGDRYVATPTADVVMRWAREPFWVDIVKVGVAPADDTIDPGGIVLRTGSERDHDVSWISPDVNTVRQKMVVRNQVKRLSGKRSITELTWPPTSHVWALSQLQREVAGEWSTIGARMEGHARKAHPRCSAPTR